MATENILIPNTEKYELAKNLLQDIKDSNSYYFFQGNHIESSNTLLIDNLSNTTYSVYNNMIQGKKISSNDVSFAIKNIPYELNTKYDIYSHDSDLSNKNFFAIVNASSYYHVFKCLDNNNNSNSTVEPTFSDISGSNTEIYRTSDGYVWKYMYSVSSSIADKFESENYFPFIANNEVSEQSKNGAIDVITVKSAGRRYDNYIVGTFSATDIKVNGNSALYAISNSVAATVNGFYTGCLLYISSGSGAGDYRIITDYISNSNGNFAVLNENLESPQNGTQYQIYPNVLITGTGSQTSNAVARALVNSLASNSIFRIEIIDRGENYTFYTANVVANDVVNIVEAAQLNPIYSPSGGHGYDQGNELYCSTLCISAKFQNTDPDAIMSNDYHQVGIIKNPLFANVLFNVSISNGAFVGSEEIINIFPTQIATGTANDQSNTIILDTAQDYLQGNQILLISNGNFYQIVNNATLSNSTSLTIPTNCNFSCTSVSIYLANPKASAKIKSQVNSSSIFLTNVNGNFSPNDVIIGYSSGVKATIDSIFRNDVNKEFQTFIQANKYKGSSVVGSFSNDETLIQSNSSATLHSYSISSNVITFYVTNESKRFYEGSVEGRTSLAQCIIDECYSPEIVFGSGKLIYLENLDDPIEKQVDKTEDFTIYMEF